MKNKNFFLLVVLLFSPLLLFSQDFEVAPAYINFITNLQDSSKNYTQTRVSVINHANQKQTFEMSLDSLHLGQEWQALQEQADNHNIAEWISISPNSLSLNPNETGYFDVNIDVPPTEVNDRWGMLYVNAVNENTNFSADKENTRAGLSISPRIAIMVTHTFKTDKEGAATIKSLKKLALAEGDSLRSFQAEIENTGKRILECHVFLVLSNLQTGKRQQFKPQTFRSFPGYRRTVKLQLPQRLEPGKYVLGAVLNFGDSSRLEGTQIIINSPPK